MSPRNLGVNPKTNGMPDLRLSADHVRASTRDVLFGLGATTTQPAQAYYHRLVQLADKGVREWAAAREHLDRRESGGDYLEIFLASDHLENVVDAVYRALVFARRLAEVPGLSDIVAPLLPPEDQRKKLGGLRHAVQHIDAATVWDAESQSAREESRWPWIWKIGDGDAGSLAISDDGVVLHIADQSLTFVELGELLMASCRIATSLSGDPTVGGRRPDPQKGF